jgi:hypothetical protein
MAKIISVRFGARVTTRVMRGGRETGRWRSSCVVATGRSEQEAMRIAEAKTAA